MAWFHDQCCGTKEHASGLHQGHFKLTSGYCVTKASIFQAPILRKLISPMTRFDALHGAIHKGDLANLDAEYRPLMRMVVGPPRNIGCASPWHDIGNEENQKVGMLSDHAGLKPWFVTCKELSGNFGTLDLQDSGMEHF